MPLRPFLFGSVVAHQENRETPLESQRTSEWAVGWTGSLGSPGSFLLSHLFARLLWVLVAARGTSAASRGVVGSFVGCTGLIMSDGLQ